MSPLVRSFYSVAAYYNTDFFHHLLCKWPDCYPGTAPAHTLNLVSPAATTTEEGEEELSHKTRTGTVATLTAILFESRGGIYQPVPFPYQIKSATRPWANAHHYHHPLHGSLLGRTLLFKNIHIIRWISLWNTSTNDDDCTAILLRTFEFGRANVYLLGNALHPFPAYYYVVHSFLSFYLAVLLSSFLPLPSIAELFAACHIHATTAADTTYNMTGGNGLCSDCNSGGCAWQKVQPVCAN